MSTVKQNVPITCEPPSGRPPVKMHVAWERGGTITAVTPLGVEIPMAATDRALKSREVPSALEVFVASLGGCPAHEILTIMNEREEIVRSIGVEITGNRRPTPPTVFDTLHVAFTLAGDIDDAYARTVIHDVMTRRCPVAVSFGRASYLTWEHRIIPASDE